MSATTQKIGLRVVLFEGEDGVRKLLAAYMRRLGCEVYAYSRDSFCPIEEGGTCPLTPDRACADVIIADAHMPLVDALAMVEDHLRKGCKAKAIALMSIYGRLDDQDRIEKLGVQFFQKPFPMEQLELWLRSAKMKIDDGRKLIDLPPERTKDAE